MVFAEESFIILKSEHLVQIVNPACNSLWDISVTPSVRGQAQGHALASACRARQSLSHDAGGHSDCRSR